MRITIRLFASLRQGHSGEESLDVEPGATVHQVIERLEVPEDRVTLIFVNGRHAEPDLELAEGDAVALFPPVGGG